MEDLNWSAKWIWPQPFQGKAAGYQELVYFRRTFTAPDRPETLRLTVNVSADSRYRLYLNGRSVSFGPCKGEAWTHYYETVDLSGLLVPGKNVLAAKVLHYPHSQPFVKSAAGSASVFRSDTGAFLLEGVLQDAEGNVLETVSTDNRWVWRRDDALSFEKETITFFIGGTETVEGSRLPHGWETAGYDDGDWTPAAVVSDILDRRYGQLRPWQLERRPIPLMHETPRGFSRVMRKNGFAQSIADERLLSVCSIAETGESVVVPAGESLTVELDAGELATGYIRLAVSGGAGGVVSFVCAECYEYPKDTVAPGETSKAVRDDPEGKILRGNPDTYCVAGVGNGDLQPEIYETFVFRTFRFVKLHIEAGSEPLELHRFIFRDTGYPLDITGGFECSDPTFKPLWDISINTLLRCMHETYEDCPYFEQMQYTMDTRLQMLFNYAISTDDRLARKAIYEFHASLLPSGMLQCRYPSIHPQVIPGFALYWVMMVHDHYMHYGDLALVKRYRPTIDAVLDWFDRILTEDGLVGKVPVSHWSFVDWVKEWRVNAGVPLGYERGPITVYSLMYAYTLKKAADLSSWSGRPDTAREYEERADRLLCTVRTLCWSPERKLFKDGPEVEEYSQHVQIWAVLAGLASGDEARALMDAVLTDKSLYQVSYAMAYFLFRALSEIGQYDRSFALWDTWRRLAELNLTTWVEDPVSQRSDCHAWGAAPLSEFPTEILGVKPAEPGFAVIRVAPQVGPLQWARGTVPTAKGSVRVTWRKEDEMFQLTVEGPANVPLELHLPDGSVRRFEDASRLTEQCSLAVHS